MLFAGIDIGTLTCRLLIAEVDDDFSMKEIDSDRQILRLGEGVDRSGFLDSAAMSRVLRALSEWRVRMQAYPLTSSVVVATSAVREARNRAEFCAAIKMEAGFEIEVLSGEEEARRTLLGIESGLPGEVGRFLGLDIGGGSTEFMKVAKDLSANPVQVFSLDVGVVRLTEREFHTEDLPSEQSLMSAERTIQTELETVSAGLGDLQGVTCVGTAGTITTLAAMAQKLSKYESARIHNYRLTLQKIQGLERELRSRTRAERREIPGLETGREDVIVAGTVILRVVMQTLGFQECLVSDYGLREGILVHEAARIKGEDLKV